EKRSERFSGRVLHPGGQKRLTTMTTSIRRRRLTRVFALSGKAVIIASAGIGWHALSASAAFPGQPYETQFEIDGNIAVDGAQDWASTPASAPNLQGAPFEDTEVCDKNPAVVNGEVVTDDPTRVVPGTKIDDILIASPPIGGSNVPNKTDP